MSESPKSKPEGAPSPAGFVSLKILKGTPAADPAAEIRRIYYHATRGTIAHDLAEAIELLKQLPTEEERERVAVFMDGLAEMRSDWERQARRGGPAGTGGTKPRSAKRTR